MKTRRYASPLIASVHTKWSEEEIREAHETINKYRTYNTNTLQTWNTKENTFSEVNHFAEARQICTEAEIDLDMLLDYHCNDLTMDEFKDKYGSESLAVVGNQSRKLKQLAIAQGYKT